MVFSWADAILRAERHLKVNLKIAEKNGDQDLVRKIKMRLERYAKHS